MSGYFFFAWLLFNFSMHQVLTQFNKTYRLMSDWKDKADYLSYSSALIHAICSVINSIYIQFFICGDLSNFWNDFYCANTVRYFHIWAIDFSAGYLLSDFCMNIWVGNYTSKLQ